MLDGSQRRLLRSGEDVYLPPKTFELLLTLFGTEVESSPRMNCSRLSGANTNGEQFDETSQSIGHSLRCAACNDRGVQRHMSRAQTADDVKAAYTKYEYRIPMRDGVKLFTAVYVPKDTSQKYPILLNRTPYSVAPYGADKYQDALGPSPLFAKRRLHLRLPGRARALDVRGRVRRRAAAQRQRRTGRRTSTRAPTPTTRSTGSSRTSRTTTARSACGASRIPASTLSCGMIDAHPALKAVSPQAPVADWFVGDDFHHNGALFLPHCFQLLCVIRPAAPGADHRSSPPPFEHGTPDGYEFFLRDGPARQRGREVLQGRRRLLERDDAAPELRRVLEGAQHRGRT